MAADGLQQVDEKEFADLQSRCRVNKCSSMLILCLIVFMFDKLLCKLSESFMNCALHNLAQLVEWLDTSMCKKRTRFWH